MKRDIVQLLVEFGRESLEDWLSKLNRLVREAPSDVVAAPRKGLHVAFFELLAQLSPPKAIMSVVGQAMQLELAAVSVLLEG